MIVADFNCFFKSRNGGILESTVLSNSLRILLSSNSPGILDFLFISTVNPTFFGSKRRENVFLRLFEKNNEVYGQFYMENCKGSLTKFVEVNWQRKTNLRSQVYHGCASELVEISDEPFVVKPQPNHQIKGKQKGFSKIPNRSIIVREVFAVYPHNL